MFRKDYTLKSEIMVIDTGKEDPVKAGLAINIEDAELYVTVDDLNGNTCFWIFAVEDNFGRYFDIKNSMEAAILQSNDIDEFVNVLNKIFLDRFCEDLLESSFIDECEECENKDSCEEYLKHKN